MSRDTYSRFLRSEQFKEMMTASQKGASTGKTSKVQILPMLYSSLTAASHPQHWQPAHSQASIHSAHPTCNAHTSPPTLHSLPTPGCSYTHCASISFGSSPGQGAPDWQGKLARANTIASASVQPLFFPHIRVLLAVQAITGNRIPSNSELNLLSRTPLAEPTILASSVFCSHTVSVYYLRSLFGF